MAASMEEDDPSLEDDYYAFLNVSRTATSDEITNAYRRLSKLYHPDKHLDPESKQEAEILFNKTKKAYEVLIDSHKRAIYDTLGEKGLETVGWEVVQRTKTPQEIREEYEQLAREREQRLLQQRTNPKGTVSIGVNATDLFDTYDAGDRRGYMPHIEISSMHITQSIDAPLNNYDVVTLNGALSTQNGTGSGNVSCSLRHVIDAKSWTEVDIGAGSGLVCTLKGFRNVSKHCFATLNGIFHFTSLGVHPGMQAVLGRQLDKHTVGYLTWKAGHQSSMNTMVIWDTKTGRFVCGIQFGIPHSYLLLTYTHKFGEEGKVRGSIKVGTFGSVVEYGCEKKISEYSVIGASVAMEIPRGVTLKLRLNRSSQNYIMPIHLSEEILPSAVFYGTVIPLVGWYILNTVIIRPYQEKQRQKEAQKAREANASKLAERKKEAEAAISLMKETYQRIKDQESSKSGLVINLAVYGNFDQSDEDSLTDKNSEAANVTLPLQCLVKDSKLSLTPASKRNLPGFYDPCLGEDKFLLVRYFFRNLPHEVVVGDFEELHLPKDLHLVKS